MLPKHADCASCCAQGRCHFCLQAARHAFDDGRNAFACCTTHLLWLAREESAPGATQASLPVRTAALTLPAADVAVALANIGAQPSSIVGNRLLTTLGSLEPPMLLRDSHA